MGGGAASRKTSTDAMRASPPPPPPPSSSSSSSSSPSSPSFSLMGMPLVSSAMESMLGAGKGERLSGAATGPSKRGSAEEESKKRERVLWCGFDELEMSQTSTAEARSCKVLMLAYEDGFQIWSVAGSLPMGLGEGGKHAGDGRNTTASGGYEVRELVSRRDGCAVRKVCCLPLPRRGRDNHNPGGVVSGNGFLQDYRPAVAVLCEGYNGSQSTSAARPRANEAAGNLQADGARSRDGLEDDGGGDPEEGEKRKNSVLRVYSLISHAFVHSVHFKAKVGDVLASRRLVLVTMPGRLEAYAADTFNRVFTVMAYESVLGSEYTVAALGPRWLAYSAADTPPSTPAAAGGNAMHQRLAKGSRDGDDKEGTAYVDMDMVATQALHVAGYAAAGGKEVMSKMRSLSETGYKAFSDYFFKDPHGASTHRQGPGAGPGTARPRSSSFGRDAGGNHMAQSDSGCGVVLVRDVVTGDQVAHFRAHDSPLAQLAFSSAGTLLTSASVTGNNINVFKIIPGSRPSYQHLYKLHRGLTNATIRSIAFTHDDRWIAASTGRGTTHIFAISEGGGAVSADTHCSRDEEATPIGTKQHVDAKEMPPLRCTEAPTVEAGSAIKYTSLVRLKCLDPWTDAAVQVSSAACVATGLSGTASGAAAATFVSSAPAGRAAQGHNAQDMDDALVFSPSGSLTRYRLKPECEKVKGSSTKEQLSLREEAADRWDVRRRHGWPERQEDFEDCDTCTSNAAEACAAAQRVPWSAHAELLVHQPVQRPLWLSSQFHFHVVMPEANTVERGAAGLEPAGVVEHAPATGGNLSPANHCERDESSTAANSLGVSGSGRRLGMEAIPTRRVDVRRVSARGLIPVCDNVDRVNARLAPVAERKPRATSKAMIENDLVDAPEHEAGPQPEAEHAMTPLDSRSDRSDDPPVSGNCVDTSEGQGRHLPDLMQLGEEVEGGTESGEVCEELNCSNREEALMSPEAEEAWGISDSAWDNDFGDDEAASGNDEGGHDKFSSSTSDPIESTSKGKPPTPAALPPLADKNRASSVRVTKGRAGKKALRAQGGGRKAVASASMFSLLDDELS